MRPSPTSCDAQQAKPSAWRVVAAASLLGLILVTWSVVAASVLYPLAVWGFSASPKPTAINSAIMYDRGNIRYITSGQRRRIDLLKNVQRHWSGIVLLTVLVLYVGFR